MARHTNFASLGKALVERGVEIEEETAFVMKTAASEGAKAAILNTPQDTGAAASNWITTTGQPLQSGTRIPFAKGSRLGVGNPQNVNPAINDANARLRRYQVKDGSIFITNLVPYIGALDRGSSPQSPGMVMFALEAISRVFRRAGLFRKRQLGRLNNDNT